MLPELPPPETTPLFPDEQQSPAPLPSRTRKEETPLPTTTPGRKPTTSPSTRIVAVSIGLDIQMVPVGCHVEGSNHGIQVV